MIKKLFTLLFLLSFNSVFAQNFYTLRGFIYSENNEPIVGASIRVFNLNTGTNSSAEGKYEIRLIEGLNRITVSNVGYLSETFEIVMGKDASKNIILQINQKELDEVVVKIKKRDFSYEVIKKVLENKQNFLNQYKNFKCETYIKAIENIERKPVSKPDSAAKKDTLPKMNLFECKLIRHENTLGQQKEEKLAVKKVGEQRTLFFKSVTDGEFNLYKNHQRIEKIGQNEYTSPLSDLTFLAYKFQLLKYYFEGKDKIYRIKVTPRELGNALYEGEIEVIEDLWVLRKAELSLTKRGLLIYDEFRFEQFYENISNRWIPAKTIYQWKLKEAGKKKIGETVVIQSNFEFDLDLPKRFFGVEVGKTDEQAYKRDSTFWESIRPQPLSSDEIKVIKEKERLELLQNSKAYLDSIDKIYNRITLPKIAYLGIGHINRAKKTEWSFNPVLGMIDPFTVGGFRIQYGANFQRKFENKHRFSIGSNLTYGLRNEDLKGAVRLNYFYNPIRQSNINVNFGSGFGVINGAATIRDFARRENFYEQRYLSLNHRTELLNGLYLNSSVYYERRNDLSGYKLGELSDRIFQDNQIQPFPTSHTYKAVISIDYTPQQLYLREPDQKIILGSNFPTFSAKIEKAFPMKNRITNQFSYISLGMRQEFNVGVFGTSEYNIRSGKFLDTTSLAPMDFKYIRGGDNYFFFPPMQAFQLIPNTFTVFNWFFEAHYTHQFNGYLTSKIPLLNKTGIKEMVGGGFLYVPERKYQYSELYGGLNRVFKIGRERIRLGAYYVVAQSNDFGFRSGFKFSIEPYNQFKNTWSF